MSSDEEEQQTEPAVEEAPAEAASAESAVAAAPADDSESDSDREERPQRDDAGGDDRDRNGDRDDDRGGRRRFYGRRKVCIFCVDRATAIDYKDPAKLRRFVSDRGRIEARRRTGTCAKHQRWLAVALKRARHLALLPYAPEHIRITGAFASRR